MRGSFEFGFPCWFWEESQTQLQPAGQPDRRLSRRRSGCSFCDQKNHDPEDREDEPAHRIGNGVSDHRYRAPCRFLYRAQARTRRTGAGAGAEKDAWMESMQGAILLSKTRHDPTPIDNFRKILFSTVLKVAACVEA
jgi:hypothetical protein